MKNEKLKQHAQEIFKLLEKHYPNAKMILKWGNNFELLVSIILSAQCTDKKVNEVTEIVFPKYKKSRVEFLDLYKNYEVKIKTLSTEELVELINFANVSLVELETDIKSTGFYHNKAKSVQGAAKYILDDLNGVLPKTIEDLIKIPGVGRKTANVFLGNAYHIYEGIAVDTHVTKQSQSLGLTKNTDPVKIEKDLMELFPNKDWFKLTYLLIEHGRNMRMAKNKRIICDDKNCILCSK